MTTVFDCTSCTESDSCRSIAALRSEQWDNHPRTVRSALLFADDQGAWFRRNRQQWTCRVTDLLWIGNDESASPEQTHSVT